MRHLKKYVALMLALCCLMGLASAVSADENEIDWSEFDWEKVELRYVEYDVWESMCEYFKTDAELELLFYIRGKTDGMYSTDMDGILSDRFLSDPNAMLTALTDLDFEERQDMIHSIVWGADDLDEMLPFLETVKLAGSDAEAGYEVLAEMIAYAEEAYGVDINNPKTGDPVGIVMAVMALCCVGAAGLIWRRRKIFAT